MSSRGDGADRSTARGSGSPTRVQPPAPLPTNDAIEWTGQRYGLKPYLDQHVLDQPVLETAGTDEVAEVDEVAAVAPTLIEALDDPDRFVVAHVLLTRLSRVSHETFPGWNGLAVELAVDGTSWVDPAQRAGGQRNGSCGGRGHSAIVAPINSHRTHGVQECPPTRNQVWPTKE